MRCRAWLVVLSLNDFLIVGGHCGEQTWVYPWIRQIHNIHWIRIVRVIFSRFHDPGPIGCSTTHLKLAKTVTDQDFVILFIVSFLCQPFHRISVTYRWISVTHAELFDFKIPWGKTFHSARAVWVKFKHDGTDMTGALVKNDSDTYLITRSSRMNIKAASHHMTIEWLDSNHQFCLWRRGGY